MLAYQLFTTQDREAAVKQARGRFTACFTADRPSP